MGPDNAALALPRDQVLGICAGTAFVMVGIAAWARAAVVAMRAWLELSSGPPRVLVKASTTS